MLLLLAELHLTLLQLIPMDVLPPTASATNGNVYPDQGNGFAAAIIGGFFGVGVLILVAILISTKPRRRSNRR